jgi:hypothetical protein
VDLTLKEDVFMTIKLLSFSGNLAVFLLLSTIWGCASKPVPVNMPENHPANPAAAETAYTMVPDPFKSTGSMDKMMMPDGASMPHNKRDDSPATKIPMHDKGHKDPVNSGNLHQEHN